MTFVEYLATQILHDAGWGLYYLEYINIYIVPGCRMVTVVPQVATSRVPPLLPSSEPSRRYTKLFICARDTHLKMFLLESAICAPNDCLNSIFLGGLLPELFNQFLWVLCIAM